MACLYRNRGVFLAHLCAGSWSYPRSFCRRDSLLKHILPLTAEDWLRLNHSHYRSYRIRYARHCQYSHAPALRSPSSSAHGALFWFHRPLHLLPYHLRALQDRRDCDACLLFCVRHQRPLLYSGISHPALTGRIGTLNTNTPCTVDSHEQHRRVSCLYAPLRFLLRLVRLVATNRPRRAPLDLSNVCMQTGMSFSFSGIGAPRRLSRRRSPPQPSHGPLRPLADLLWRRHAQCLRNARHSTRSKVRHRHHEEDLGLSGRSSRAHSGMAGLYELP